MNVSSSTNSPEVVLDTGPSEAVVPVKTSRPGETETSQWCFPGESALADSQLNFSSCIHSRRERLGTSGTCRLF